MQIYCSKLLKNVLNFFIKLLFLVTIFILVLSEKRKKK